MKNFLENVKLTVQMTIIGAIILYIGTLVFMPELTVKIFRFHPYVVVTESMEPVINVNDMVIATPFNIEDAEVGDIITFKADIDYNGTQEVVTHYIYSIDETGDEAIIRTNRHFEDDETIVPDTWLIAESDVLGSHGVTVKYLGFLVGFLRSIYGITIVVINIVIFSTISFLNKRNRSQAQTEEVTQSYSQHNKTPNLS